MHIVSTLARASVAGALVASMSLPVLANVSNDLNLNAGANVNATANANVSANANTSTNTAINTNTTVNVNAGANVNAPRRRHELDKACMQAAIEERDTAIVTAVDAWHATVKIALTRRKDALKAAWNIEERHARRQAIRQAWSDYRKSSHEARRELRRDKHEAWETFRRERKDCRVSPSDDQSSASLDAHL